ncbi:MAG TPA: hypothetical protein VF945_06330, partial [Polyangia bacterium]
VRKLTMMWVTLPLLGAAPAFAQVHVEVVAPPPPHVVVSAPPPRVVVPPPPVVRFAAPPPLVVVEPGVQVVRDCDDEIFFSGGWYWHAGPEGTWYRTRSYRGGWVAAPRRAVPVAVARLPRGQYRHFRGEAWREQRRDERRDERAMRHEEKREEKGERREEKTERRWEKHHGRRG